MPLFNEAQGVTATVRSLQQVLRQAHLSYQLLLVNNGSSDATGERLLELARQDPAIEIVSVPVNRGYGSGILAGMARARAPILGYLWGDEQVSHAIVPRLYARLKSGGSDLVKVRRVVRLDGLHRRLITRSYHALFPLFAPRPSQDVHGCPKLFTRAAWEQLSPKATDWFLDAEILLRAQSLGLRLEELDVVAYPRETGHSKVRWKTLLEFAANLARVRATRER